jgi:hypothetical protein
MIPYIQTSIAPLAPPPPRHAVPFYWGAKVFGSDSWNSGD